MKRKKVYDMIKEIGYNKGCVSSAGSAIFLHCVCDGLTFGSVAIPQSGKIFILQNVRSDTLFVIADDLSLY